MHSSRNDAAAAAALVPLTEAELPAEPSYSAATATRDLRQRSWVKRLLPQTMFGRSLLLIVMPLVLVQIIATWVFYARHWETVSRRLSADTAGDIGLVIDGLRYADNATE